jgi:phage gp36-like protein
LYSTIQEILESGLTKAELIHLLNDEERLAEDIDLESADDLLVKRAAAKIKKAATYIDGFLRGRFELPLQTVPELIKDYSNDISIYYIYEHRHKIEMAESLVTRFKDVTKNLMEIQKGNINPGIPEKPDNSAAVNIKTDKSSKNKIFTDDYLEDF